MDDTYYFEKALQNLIGCNEYTWKTHDNNGNKIPNENRMQYQYIVLTKDGLSMPSETDLNAKIQELKDEDATKKSAYKNDKTSAINKLKGATYSALTDDEITALFGA
jgi:thiamine biosynthesis lipoprotein ApbE